MSVDESRAPGFAWIDIWGAQAESAFDPLAQEPALTGERALLGFAGVDAARRPAVLMFPGGGYAKLVASKHAAMAELFRKMGLHTFILGYRLTPHHTFPAALNDARRAVQLVRHHALAGRLPVDPDRLVVFGTSAGGHLAALLATEPAWSAPAIAHGAGLQSPLPNAHVCCFPVIHLQGEDAHHASRERLLGPGAVMGLASALEPDRRVHAGVSPAFIWHTAEDPTVRASNSLAYAQSLLRAGVSTDLHVWNPGGHGLMPAQDVPEIRDWLVLLRGWLERLGFVGGATGSEG